MQSGVCDICGTEVGTTGGSQIPAPEMSAVVAAGFNPYRLDEHLGLPGLALGVSYKAQYDNWRQMAVGQTTDWRLCVRCTDSVAPYRPSAPPRVVSANATSLREVKAIVPTTLDQHLLKPFDPACTPYPKITCSGRPAELRVDCPVAKMFFDV